MLELEVVPERSLGCEQWEFILGMHFSQAIGIIQTQVGIIKGAEVLYSDTNPLAVDLVINLAHDGVKLIFDSFSQRLKMIEIYNMKLIKLRYNGKIFNSPEVLPSIEQIEYSFGATHPGVYDKEKQIFQLNFRGLSFSFPVETKFQPGYAHGLGSLQFQNGSSPIVCKTSLYSGNNINDCKPPALPLSCYNGHLYLDKLNVITNKNRTRGIKLQLYTEGSCRYLEPKRQTIIRTVWLGDTCQDIVTSLGAPSRLFYKSEDKMKIHSPNAHRRSTLKSDYFYNYFTLGMDILFDATTQRAKKFILHTNYPGHYNFNMYHRCEFELEIKKSEEMKRQEEKENNGNSGKKNKKAWNQQQMTTSDTVVVKSYTKWKDIVNLVKRSDRPVVLNRTCSTNTTNPFGSTFCYPLHDLIFEVMSNQHIASITIYQADVIKNV